MSDLRVRWEIDAFDVDSPLEAALQARRAQTRPDTTATVFEVFGPDRRLLATVDLSAGPDQEVTLAEPGQGAAPDSTPLAAVLCTVVGDTTPEQQRQTVDGAANLTAYEWVGRAIETLRQADDGEDSTIGDVLDDLSRARKRMDAARPAALTAFQPRPGDAPAEGLYVAWDDHGSGPVLAVLNMTQEVSALVARGAASVTSAGMVEGTFSASGIRAYFIEGFEDRDSSVAEVFSATTSLPVALLEDMEESHDEANESRLWRIDGADVSVVLARLESIKDMHFAERLEWGVAEVLAAEALVVRNGDPAFAFASYGQIDDNGKVCNMTVGFPRSSDVPTLDLEQYQAPRP